MKKFAAEKLDINQTIDRLDVSIKWANTVLKRLAPYLPEGNLNILEIGCAQGRALIGLAKAGHSSNGVEPNVNAIKIAKELASRENVVINIREGWAEDIPFDSNLFDLVLAFAVMEHVNDLEKSLSEVYRVLKPGGIFWFSSASAMCPIQHEIDGFPFFGWYPDRVKKKIMLWAVRKKPELVGFTEHPAINWWTPNNARERLQKAGFKFIGDQWDLRMKSEDAGIKSFFINLAKRYSLIRLFGNIVYPGCSYAAMKR